MKNILTLQVSKAEQTMTHSLSKQNGKQIRQKITWCNVIGELDKGQLKQVAFPTYNLAKIDLLSTTPR